ncbi:glutathione peroxidase [Xanthomarina gelatinilytica]|jgi:glutathione peroxidase|uniref:glutathione peroxidase n=2 Tax=Xanthomarina gelatinilytica TaxID=1137281 RepID=UPI003AA80CB5
MISLIFFNNLKTNKSMQASASLYDISINSLTGEAIDLSSFKGKKILIVNTASECGFTGQYEGLQELYNTYKDKLVVIGVPCNQFGGQEPGTASEIQSFCKQNYGVTFLMTEKVDVKGGNQHPLYKWLTSKELNGVSSSSVKWNFQKYLIDEKGNLIDYYYSITSPTSTKITKHLK